ncbi:MAG: hypothetical protein ACREIP_14680 [Alphaproteobacteria bacterium]
MMRNAGKDWRLAVRMLCAVALLCVAFAHRPVSAAPSDAPDLSAYALPDGSLPTLCLTDTGDGDHHDKAWHGNGCEACRLSASVVLPVPASAQGRKIVPLQALGLLREAAFIARSAWPPSAPPQAPPFA